MVISDVLTKKTPELSAEGTCPCEIMAEMTSCDLAKMTADILADKTSAFFRQDDLRYFDQEDF